MNSPIKILKQYFLSLGSKPAIIEKSQVTSYQELAHLIEKKESDLLSLKIPNGSCVLLYGDNDADSLALLFALAARKCLVAPRLKQDFTNEGSRHDILCADFLLYHESKKIKVVQLNQTEFRSEYFTQLREQEKPGLLLLTSGTSGTPKVAIHDFSHFLKLPKNKIKSHRTLAFLLFDHIGGVHTNLMTLKSGGALIHVEDRNPSLICKLIHEHSAELLPATPTFLRLLYFFANQHVNDLQSLQLITYGTEPMPETLLNQITSRLGWVRFKQTYGMSEVGILPSKSESSSSTWMKIGSEENLFRIREGLLEIKNNSSILGYLNAPSPFTDDGWFKTNDIVEQNGEWLRILGKNSNLINVGGQKVDPIRVLNTLYQLTDLIEARVYGEKHLFMGEIVVAEVSLTTESNPEKIRQQIRLICEQTLLKHEVPQKIIVTSSCLHTKRFKSGKDK